MSKAVRSTKRVKFLETIIKKMAKHELLCGDVNKSNLSENEIQRAVFLRIKEDLPKILQSQFGYSKEDASIAASEEFVWEQNVNTTVNNFSFFATNHRPDSVLSIKDELRIAIEIKKGDSGSSLRSGLGQSLVYSTQFHFVIYFFIDTTNGLDIKSAYTGEKEKHLIDSLWNNYNIKFRVV